MSPFPRSRGLRDGAVVVAHPRYPRVPRIVDGPARAVERWLAAHPPDLVILTAAPQYTLLGADGRALRGARAARAWAAAYARTIAAMPADVPVMLLHEIPRPRVS